MKVVELFAGVGGFRLGLEGPPGSPRNRNFKIVLSNQWEPKILKQHAAEIYIKRWGLEPVEGYEHAYHHPNHPDDTFWNKDINDLAVDEIPSHDLLVGGFPCQDYSVAQGHRGKGIEGKKGVLWWQIVRIIEASKPKFILLENVGRLTSSPAKQRGRDMAVMLSVLDRLNYAVEWRVVNASDYGFPQRRKRLFILAYKKGTSLYNMISNKKFDCPNWLCHSGVFAKSLPVSKIESGTLASIKLNPYPKKDLAMLSDKFNTERGESAGSPFMSSGVMVNNQYWTTKLEASSPISCLTLRDVLFPASKILDEFIVDAKDVVKPRGWLYTKGGKSVSRIDPKGHAYTYDMGGMYFPDRLNSPSRTIITGEGNSSPSRHKHIIAFKPTKKQMEKHNLNSDLHKNIREKIQLNSNMWLRRLIPEELEQLNGFPINHTKELLPSKRAFVMGNALVIGIVQKIGDELAKRV